MDIIKLARIIEQEWESDYFRFELMSTAIEIISHQQVGNTLSVKYHFWDAQSYVTDEQNCFLFDIKNQYGTNFPACLISCVADSELVWPDETSCSNLSENLVSEETLNVDTTPVEWDNPKITDELVDYFISAVDRESMAEMLINDYQANQNFPSFIPTRLKPYFVEMLNEYNSKTK